VADRIAHPRHRRLRRWGARFGDPTWIGFVDALGKGQVTEIVDLVEKAPRIASARIEAILSARPPPSPMPSRPPTGNGWSMSAAAVSQMPASASDG
jgi:hypothetical protein